MSASDIRKGAEILPAGKRLLPQDTGLAASVGIKHAAGLQRLRLGLFFTGDELVMPGEPLAPGRIYNSNRFTLRGLRAGVRLRGARLRHRPRHAWTRRARCCGKRRRNAT